MEIGKRCVEAALKAIEAAENAVLEDRENILTKADLDAQDAIIKVLEDSGKDCLLYSEELEKPKQFGKNSSIEIIVDPLDGSLNFLKGIKTSTGVGILILKNRKVLCSFIKKLSEDNMFHCDEHNAYLNGKMIKISREIKSKPYINIYAPKGDMLAVQFKKLFKLKDEAYIWNNGGMFHCGDMLLGKYDAVGESDNVPLHEFAGAAIVEKAGAILSTLDGKPVVYDPTVEQTYMASRNKELHEKIISCFK
ncbi:inositol monophosphatase family protein [candidate division KSB1 bacterium]